MGIIDQPYHSNLGKILINNLSGSYNEFKFIVAYAKKSGVHRLLPYMKSFKNNGGIITGIVGIDQLNTSYEAIKSLKDICNDLYIFHSESINQTFHPKIYLFKGENQAYFTIGSSNFTAGGLFSNYELNYSKNLDLNLSDDGLELNNIESIFNSYCDTSNPCCKVVNDKFIEDLYCNKYIKKELELIRDRIKNNNFLHNTPQNRLFGKESFIASNPQDISQNSSDYSLNGSTANNRISTAQNVSINDIENCILIRDLPRAGNRSKQVHFNMDIKDNYFRLNVNTTIQIQQVFQDSSSAKIEDRVLLLSPVNRNVKIEVNGAECLDYNYPTNGNRPILIFNKINDTFFTYMLLLDTDNGYTQLNNYLLSLPKSKSLTYKITNIQTLLFLWHDCPLL